MWYGKIERVLAPTDPIATAVLVIIAIICLWVAWKGDTVVKAALIAYIVSP